MAFDIRPGKIIPPEENVIFLVAKTSFDSEIASALDKIVQVARTCQREIISHDIYRIQEGALITAVLTSSDHGRGRLARG